MLDPVTGEVRRVVSWAELPPAPTGSAWPGPRVLGDGSSLWVQREASGPLVRVGPHGVTFAVWTRDMHLAACGPGVAWCRRQPPDQVLVHGADAHPVSNPRPDRLLRVDAAGQCVTVEAPSTVRWVQAEPGALLVEVDVPPWHLNHLGQQTYEVVWATRWLRLPWDAALPDEITVETYGLPVGDGPIRRDDDGGGAHTVWHEPDEERAAVHGGGGRQWHVGAPMDARLRRGRGYREVIASVTDAGSRTPVRGWRLGDGEVWAAAPVGERLAVAVARGSRTVHHRMPVDVVALEPDSANVQVLLAGNSVDVTERCWPLVSRPLDADSYCRQVLAANRSIDDYWQDSDGARTPLSDGISHAQTRLAGTWPDTCLEWTFAFEPYPGLVLRRRVPLFDELGRVSNPEYASVYLMEDLDTGALPPASAAENGILEI